MRVFLSVLSVFIMAFSAPVLAEEKVQGALDEKDQAARADILNKASEFAKDLDKAESRHFGVMYGNYNMISVVNTVRDHVEEAVDACGDENPDMKEALDTRFDEWEAAVDPVIEEAEANISNMVLAQEYAKPRELRGFFKDIDRARKDRNKAVKKTPVTSVEACESLLKKMDATQDNMVQLLQQTLVTLPQQIQIETEKAAEEKAEEKAAEEEAAKKAEEEAKAEKEAEAEKAE